MKRLQKVYLRERSLELDLVSGSLYAVVMLIGAHGKHLSSQTDHGILCHDTHSYVHD